MKKGLRIQKLLYANTVVFAENNISNDEAYKIYDAIAFTRYKSNHKKFEIVLSGDMNLINQTFASDATIYANGEIYTPDWINRHTAEDYINAGITKEELLEKVEMWKKWSAECEYFLEIENIEAEIAKMP